MRVALVSCVKKKGPSPAAAGDLYVSALFRGMRAYAESHADAWYVLSAEHGLLDPTQVIAPYEKTLNVMPKAERMVWANRVTAALLQVLPPRVDVVMLAGARYRDQIEPFLRRHGHEVIVPMAGLSIGHQLKWLKLP